MPPTVWLWARKLRGTQAMETRQGAVGVRRGADTSPLDVVEAGAVTVVVSPGGSRLGC